MGTAAPNTCLHTHSDSAPLSRRGSQGLKHTFTFSCFNLKNQTSYFECLRSRPPWDLAGPEDALEPGLLLMSGLCEGPARSSVPGVQGFPGGAPQEGLAAASEKGYQRSDRRFCFCENKVRPSIQEQRGACTEGPRARWDGVLHLGCPFALPLNSFHFSHEQTVSA